MFYFDLYFNVQALRALLSFDTIVVTTQLIESRDPKCLILHNITIGALLYLCMLRFYVIYHPRDTMAMFT